MGWGFGTPSNQKGIFGVNTSSHDSNRKTWVGAGTIPSITTGVNQPSLVSIAGITPASINMLPWSALAQASDFTQQYNFLGASIQTGVISPSGANDAQDLVEDTSTGQHYVASLDATQCHTVLPFSMRLATIAKANGRSRIVMTVEAFVHEAAVSASAGFDLKGGNTNYDNQTGTDTSISAVNMTSLGSGWWLCQFDWQYTGNSLSSFVLRPRINLDNGTGTTARSVSYTGNGLLGVDLWWFNLLPTAAWSITTNTTYDDFNNTNTIDLANTLNPGFKWYINNSAPNSPNTQYWSPANLPPSLPANFKISSPSVLKIYDPNANQPTWGSLMYSVGFLQSGGYVGQAWGAPVVFDGYFSFVNPNPRSDFGVAPAFWGHTVEAMAGTMNPSNHWLEWDWMDVATRQSTAQDEYLPSGAGSTPTINFLSTIWSPPRVTSEGTFFRLSGLWLNTAANGYTYGCFMSFFNGQFVIDTDIAYTFDDFSQPADIWPKGMLSQSDWHHLPIMINGGNSNSSTLGGWPVFIDWIRVFTNPTPSLSYNYWDIFDQAGDLTVTSKARQITKTASGGIWEAIRSTFGKSSGLWYWEITITGSVNSATSLMLGIMNQAASVASDAFPGSSASGAGARHGSNWDSFISGVTGLYSGSVTFANNDVFGFAFDANAGIIYVSRNGSWLNGTPGGTGVWGGMTTGTWFPAAAIHDASVSTIVANFGLSAFVGPVPNGYSPLTVSPY